MPLFVVTDEFNVRAKPFGVHRIERGQGSKRPVDGEHEGTNGAMYVSLWIRGTQHKA